jgi:hypothetical protein
MRISDRMDKILVETRLRKKRDALEGDLWQDFVDMVTWNFSRPKYQDERKLARTIARIAVGIRLYILDRNLEELVQEELDRIQVKLEKKPRNRRSRR